MLDPNLKRELEAEQYRFVGSHSAVKICGWTKTALRGGGQCYKHAFYGIRSFQCLQMTTAMSCANRCLFCWRSYKAPVAKEWRGPVDEPARILDESIREHHQLLVGFKGNEKASRKLYEASLRVKHAALSLTGEPIIYPRINELIRLCDQRGISTFLVTNGQYPDAIKELAPVTQLYLSLDAPTKELLKRVDVPLFKDFWERLLNALDQLAKKEQRTCIRLTMIKELNITGPREYASLILKGNPDFIEVKAYMHLGASQQRLARRQMPTHEEVSSFAKELLAHLPGYAFVTSHEPSRVVLLAKESFRRDGEWRTWINFPAYQRLALAGKRFTSGEYTVRTPPCYLPTSRTGSE